MRAWLLLVLHAATAASRPEDADAAAAAAAAAARKLSRADRDAFLEATGRAPEAVAAALVENPANASLVASPEKFVPHALNAQGLHALRALVTESLERAFAPTPRTSSPAERLAAAWRSRLTRDGITVEPFAAADMVHKRREDGTAYFELPARLQEGLNALVWPKAVVKPHLPPAWRESGAPPGDRQTWMHVDTFQLSHKVWIFRNLSRAQGPFHYIKGSHRNDARKLRWLFERTRRLVSDAALPRAAPLSYPPGPFSDAVHGYEGSLRVYGFDPRDATTHGALAGYGFPRPEPIVAGGEGPANAVLVVAGTRVIFRRRASREDRRGSVQVP